MAENQITPRNPRFKDLTGKRFGRLTVLHIADRIRMPSGQSAWRWLCQCDCGATIVVRGVGLKADHTKSCGCFRKDETKRNFTKHGHAQKGIHNRTYKSWAQAKQRCANPNSTGYENYGGRGITMCDRWKDSFENFLADMGECPENLEIERLENDKGYEPGNCKWATQSEQCINQRRNPVLIVNGERTSVFELSKRSGINYSTLYTRIFHAGMKPEIAISLPVQHR